MLLVGSSKLSPRGWRVLTCAGDWQSSQAKRCGADAAGNGASWRSTPTFSSCPFRNLSVAVNLAGMGKCLTSNNKRNQLLNANTTMLGSTPNIKIPHVCIHPKAYLNTFFLVKQAADWKRRSFSGSRGCLWAVHADTLFCRDCLGGFLLLLIATAEKEKTLTRHFCHRFIPKISLTIFVSPWQSGVLFFCSSTKPHLHGFCHLVKGSTPPTADKAALYWLRNKITGLIFPVTRELPCITLICETLGLSVPSHADFTFLWASDSRAQWWIVLLPFNSSQDGECPGVIDSVQWERQQIWWPSSSSPDKAGAVCEQHSRKDYSH